MAKHKKSGVKYTSKGQRKNVNPKVLKSIKNDRTEIEKMMFKLAVYNNSGKVKDFADWPDKNDNYYVMKKTN